jgi:hypothetical protein
MRILLTRLMPAMVIAMALVVTNGFGADAAAPTPTLAKVTMRNGQVYFGEIKPQRTPTYVVVADLLTGKEQKLIRALVDRVDQPVPDDDVASACGIDVLTAWKAQAISRDSMFSTNVGKIARIDGQTIFITGNQAAVDDKLQVYQTTQITDPDTKKVIGSDTKILAELRVTEVGSGFIKAEPDGVRAKLALSSSRARQSKIKGRQPISAKKPTSPQRAWCSNPAVTISRSITAPTAT